MVYKNKAGCYFQDSMPEEEYRRKAEDLLDDYAVFFDEHPELFATVGLYELGGRKTTMAPIETYRAYVLWYMEREPEQKCFWLEALTFINAMEQGLYGDSMKVDGKHLMILYVGEKIEEE